MAKQHPKGVSGVIAEAVYQHRLSRSESAGGAYSATTGSESAERALAFATQAIEAGIARETRTESMLNELLEILVEQSAFAAAMNESPPSKK